MSTRCCGNFAPKITRFFENSDTYRSINMTSHCDSITPKSFNIIECSILVTKQSRPTLYESAHTRAFSVRSSFTLVKKFYCGIFETIFRLWWGVEKMGLVYVFRNEIGLNWLGLASLGLAWLSSRLNSNGESSSNLFHSFHKHIHLELSKFCL